MDKEALLTDKAPKPIGPYSQAVRAGDFVFVSGQIPIDPATGEIVTRDIAAATRRSMDNLVAILEQAGLTAQHVVKTTIFLSDLNDFAAVNEVYATYFKGVPPARATVQVGRLPKDVSVEIEAIAVR